MLVIASVSLSGLDHWIKLLVEDVDGDEGLCSFGLLARLEEVDGVDWDDVDVLLWLRKMDFLDRLALNTLAACWLCLWDKGELDDVEGELAQILLSWLDFFLLHLIV